VLLAAHTSSVHPSAKDIRTAASGSQYGLDASLAHIQPRILCRAAERWRVACAKIPIKTCHHG
jgi:hypothetical protein